MKKVLIIVAILAMAMPALATVSVTATDKGSGVVEVRYNCSAAEKVRSFALDISVDGALTIDGISDFNTGESKKAGGGYGIFPGKFASFINPASPNWADSNYNPVGRPTDANTRSGLGTNQITVEMGTLYVDTNSPGTSGLLFKLNVNSHGAGSGNLSIVANNTRVGCVLEDTNVVVPVLTGTALTFAPTTCSISGQVVGAAAPRTGGIGGMKLFLNGIDTGASTNASGNFTISGLSTPYTGTLTVVDGNNQWSWAPVSIPYSGVTTDQTGQNFTGTATECMNKLDAKYTRWVSFNKPECWCYQKQCKGDADGLKTLSKPVASPDLTMFKLAVGMSSSSISLCTSGGKPCICADFDHADTLGKPVGSPDLTIFKSNVGLADTSIPVCPSATINAWKN